MRFECPPTVRGAAACCVFWAIAQTAEVRGYTVDVPAARDNTLYEDLSGALSNGSGSFIFAGRVDVNGSGRLRRAVLFFDLTAFVPADATVTQAVLTLHMNNTAAGDIDVAAHRLLKLWGEAGSVAPGNEGQGGGTFPGDATWVHAVAYTSFWSTPGGDFVASSSATQVVGNFASYDWAGPGLMADVDYWRAHPDSNFGWILIGREDTLRTAKRFDSREAVLPANRPVLHLTYTLPCPVLKTGDVNVDGFLTSADIIKLVNYVFKGGAHPSPCDAAADVNCSITITSADIIGLVNHVFKGGAAPCDVCTFIPDTWTCP